MYCIKQSSSEYEISFRNIIGIFPGSSLSVDTRISYNNGLRMKLLPDILLICITILLMYEQFDKILYTLKYSDETDNITR